MNRLLLSLFAIIPLLLPLKISAQINADQVMRVGINALYFDDYMLSIQYFNKAIQAKPYLAKPYFYRAIAKLNLEDYIGAEADASEAIERNPFLTDAYEVRGVARQNRGDNAGAVADYDKALEQLPDNRGILFNKSLALSDSGDNDKARETLDYLIAAHPGFDAAYTGRAKVLIALADTVAALNDLNQAVKLNKNSANAYVMRADILMNRDHNYADALADMNEAIKLQPRFAGYFVNRAFLRYNLDDYFGAMADYDYAITLDPTSSVAYFNRGLLRAEVHDNDKAVDDFTKVLELDSSDVRARYNRSRIYAEKHDYRRALNDLDAVIAQYPDLSGLVFERFDLLNKMGDRRGAMHEYDRATAMARLEEKQFDARKSGANPPSNPADNSNPSNPTDTSDSYDRLFANRFTSLLTTENQLTDEREFNNKSIRGKVQDRNFAIITEGDFAVAYYTAPTELAPSTYYMAEADRINESRRLPMVLQVTNSEPQLDDESVIASHFKLLEQYNAKLTAEASAALDYFGRAMEHMTLHNYEAAIADFSAAISANSDFTLAYFMRAVARHRHLQSAASSATKPADPLLAATEGRMHYADIIADYDAVITLSPRSPLALFNKGNIYLETGDYTSALAAYTEAIALKSDFGEAFYNRGYVYFKLGNRQAGTADLSHAGEMGIIPSYNLLKRMAQ